MDLGHCLVSNRCRRGNICETLMFVQSAADEGSTQKSFKREAGEPMDDKEDEETVPAVEVRNAIPSYNNNNNNGRNGSFFTWLTTS